MNDEEFLARLKEVCIKFDKDYGSYPEHEYEGLHVYHSVLEDLNMNPDYVKEYDKWEGKIWVSVQQKP